ncbi:MAG: riboflavin synthase [Alphaproteobacteria bacterium]
MFTGIIKSVETIVKNKDLGGMQRLTITRKADCLAHICVDDSIAVNGVCLTIVDMDEHHMCFDILPETLKLTNLKGLQPKQMVNIEPALRMHDYMGGHNVQGHIDTTATITNLAKDGQALNVTFSLDTQFAQQNIPKGFIAIDGISLTLTHVENDSFSIMLIPHTQKQTCAKFWHIGSIVNIEIDVMAKMVFHFLKHRGDTK